MHGSMPQSERSVIIKKFLKWLEAKSKDRGAYRQECIRHIQVEISEMGATSRRANDYIEDCKTAGLLYADGLRFKITSEGKNWLQRKSLT